METTKIQKKKGIKPKISNLLQGENVSYPRSRTSSVRTTISVLKVECPEKEFDYEILENEIIVTRLK